MTAHAQLPPELLPRITAAAVQMTKAARAGLDEPTLDQLLNTVVVDLFRSVGSKKELAMPIWRAVITAQARIAARLADDWDAAASGSPATAYLTEVGSLASREAGQLR